MIRRARLEDAEPWVQALTQAMADTYAGLLPPDFAGFRWAEVPDRLAEVTARLARPEDPRETWLAEDSAGICAVAEAGPGPLEWERDNGYPPPPVPFQLIKLYALPRAYGTGVGQALMDATLRGRPAYLWLIDGNERALRFYQRNGFRPDGFSAIANPRWGGSRMLRLHCDDSRSTAT